MSLLGKVRTLVGALVHKPFAPRPEKVKLDGDRGSIEKESTLQGPSALETAEPAMTDTERVADLIARQKEGEAD